MCDSSPIPNRLPGFSAGKNIGRLMVRKSCDIPPRNLLSQGPKCEIKTCLVGSSTCA